jgi:hypothetical protein
MLVTSGLVVTRTCSNPPVCSTRSFRATSIILVAAPFGGAVGVTMYAYGFGLGDPGAAGLGAGIGVAVTAGEGEGYEDGDAVAGGGGVGGACSG